MSYTNGGLLRHPAFESASRHSHQHHTLSRSLNQHNQSAKRDPELEKGKMQPAIRPSGHMSQRGESSSGERRRSAKKAYHHRITLAYHCCSSLDSWLLSLTISSSSGEVVCVITRRYPQCTLAASRANATKPWGSPFTTCSRLAYCSQMQHWSSAGLGSSPNTVGTRQIHTRSRHW